MSSDGVDPADYSSVTAFKSAVYRTSDGAAGSWLADAKLEIIYREAHGLEIPDYLQPLLKDREQ